MRVGLKRHGRVHGRFSVVVEDVVIGCVVDVFDGSEV